MKPLNFSLEVLRHIPSDQSIRRANAGPKMTRDMLYQAQNFRRILKESEKFILTNVSHDLKKFCLGTIVGNAPYDLFAVEIERNSIYYQRTVLVAERVRSGPRSFLKVYPFIFDDEKKQWLDVQSIQVEAYPLPDDKFMVLPNVDLFFDMNPFYAADDSQKGICIRFIAAVLSICAIGIDGCKELPILRTKKMFETKPAALGFDSVKVLNLSAAADALGRMAAETSIHERHSPREHSRRGHYRTLASGKTVWIRDARINVGKGGKVDKVYEV